MTKTIKNPESLKTPPASQEQPEQDENIKPVFVSHLLEDISIVAWSKQDAPNAAYMDVIKVLSQCPRHPEVLQFAAIAEIQSSPHYPFQVQMKDCILHGDSVITLIGSRTKSVTDKCGSGFKVTTKNIMDILGETFGLDQRAVDVVAYCTVDELMEFKMDPPRGGSCRIAIASVIGVEHGQENQICIVVNKLQYIDGPDILDMQEAFTKLRTLCRHLKDLHPIVDNNKRHAEPALLSREPQSTKKCRTLARTPTDASLQSPTQTSQDDLTQDIGSTTEDAAAAVTVTPVQND